MRGDGERGMVRGGWGLLSLGEGIGNEKSVNRGKGIWRGDREGRFH